MIRLTRSSDRTVRLSQTLGVRVSLSVQRALVLAAYRLRDAVLADLPRSTEWDAIRRQLKVLAVPGQSAVAVVLQGRRPSVKEPNPEAALLLVRPRRSKLAPPSPVVQILAAFNPWTYDTLPVWPDPSDAVLLYRKVGRRMVARVSEARKAEAKLWRSALEGAGVRDTARTNPKAQASSRVVLDTAYMLAQREFGLNGTSAKPVWVPELRAFGFMVQDVLRSPQVSAALTNPTYTGYKTSVPQSEGVLRSPLRDFAWFQRKVASRLK